VRARCVALALVGLLAACDSLPRDPEHTLEDVRARHAIRVGEVLSETQAMPVEAGRLLRGLEAATGATAEITRGPMEPLLQKLDSGKLDLVIAPFAKDTPWVALASLGPVLRTEGSGEERIEWRAAMRNGENRWIMLVESRSRQAAREEGTR